MFPEKEWAVVRKEFPGRGTGAGAGILRFTLLFGSAVLALALFAVPVTMRYTPVSAEGWSQFAGLDSVITGSAGYEGTSILRRSVLRSSPETICVIRDNGSRAGDC